MILKYAYIVIMLLTASSCEAVAGQGSNSNTVVPTVRLINMTDLVLDENITAALKGLSKASIAVPFTITAKF